MERWRDGETETRSYGKMKRRRDEEMWSWRHGDMKRWGGGEMDM